MNTIHYASCKDENGTIEYICASTESELEVYCENGVLGAEKELLAWYTNPTPIMVSHHFKWVGKGRRPPQLSISREFNYNTKEPKIDNSF